MMRTTKIIGKKQLDHPLKMAKKQTARPSPGKKSRQDVEEKYRSIVENVNIGIYRNTGGPHGQFLQANPAIVRMFGYDSVEEFLTISTSALYQNQEDRKKLVEKIHQRGFVKDEQLRLRKKDGTLIWGSVTAKVQYDGRGEIAWIDGAIEDITEHKKAEERLVQSLEALQSVYNIATTIRASYEAVCEQVALNLANLLRVSHVSVEHIDEDHIRTIAGVTHGICIHNDVSLLEHSPCLHIGGRNEQYQMKGQLSQSYPMNRLIVENAFGCFVGVPIRNIGGKAVGVLSAMDREERIFNEDELRLIEIFAQYIAYELERNVMETQLRQMDRMKLLGQMTAGVAHEVRNPLNAILAITEALFQDIGSNSEYNVYLEHIRTQVDRLSRLMGELLDLGKPIQPSNLHRDSLFSICASSIDLWQQTPLSETHRARLVIPKDFTEIYIMADRERLQQVFLNLLENASQHSPDGRDIQVILSNPKGETARISIADQGCGIPSENMQRIFEPFFTTRKRGNGLGLCIVKNTIQAHGGDITARNNNPSHGCIIEITLPVIERISL